MKKMKEKINKIFRLPRKGSSYYFNEKKKQQLLFSTISLLTILIIYATGWIIYDTNKSIYTVIAAVAVLPFAKVLISYLMVMPYHSLNEEKQHFLKELCKKNPQTEVLYDVLLASEKEAVLAGTIFVLNGNIVVYAEHKNVDIRKTEDYLKKILEGCGYSSVKMYTDFDQYEKRIRELLAVWDKKEWSSQDLEWVKMQTERVCKNVLVYAI